MAHIIYRLLTYHKRKNIKMILIIALGLFFSFAVFFTIDNYNKLQIDNAYFYGGDWDVCSKGEQLKNTVQNEYSLQQTGKVSQKHSARIEENGNSDLIYLSLVESDSPQVLGLTLMEGIWPTKEGEIVLPLCLKKIGTNENNLSKKGINLEVGDRIRSDNAVTYAERCAEDEKFKVLDEKTYVVVGYYSYISLSGINAACAVIFPENWRTPGQEEASWYYRMDKYSNKAVALLEQIPNVTVNRIVQDAYNANEKLKSAVSRNRGGLFVGMAVFCVCGVIISGAVLRRTSEQKRNRALLLQLGMSRGRIVLLYFYEWIVIELLAIPLFAGLVFIYWKLVKLLLHRMTGISLSIIRCYVPYQSLVLIFTGILGIMCISNLICDYERPVKLPSGSHKLRTIDDLCVIYGKRNRFLRLGLTVMIFMALLAVSIGVPFLLGVHKEGKKYRQNQVDYDASIYLDSEENERFVKELSLSNAIEEYSAILTYGGWMEINPYVSEETRAFLKKCSYSDVVVAWDGNYRFGVRGYDQMQYEKLRSINKSLPTYEELRENDGAVLMDLYSVDENVISAGDNCSQTEGVRHFLSDQIGKNIIVSTENGQECFKIVARVETAYRELPEIASVGIIVPIENMKNGHSSASYTYYAKIKPGQEEIFNQIQAQWMAKYDLVVDYAYERIVAINSGIRIQAVLVFSVIAGVCLLAFAGTHFLIRMDMEYGRKKTGLLKKIGLSCNQMLRVRLTEYADVFLIAIASGLSFNLVMYYFVLNSYFVSFGVAPRSVLYWAIFGSVVIFVIISLDCCYFVRKIWGESE